MIKVWWKPWPDKGWRLYGEFQPGDAVRIAEEIGEDGTPVRCG